MHMGVDWANELNLVNFIIEGYCAGVINKLIV